MRTRLVRLFLSLSGATLLWCLTYAAAMVLAPAGVVAALLSVALLGRCAWRQAHQDPLDRLGAAALGWVTFVFGVSMLMPLWPHTGWRYTEAGERIMVPHAHGILDADHIH